MKREKALLQQKLIGIKIFLGELIMSENKLEFYDQVLEEEKDYNVSDPCDPNNPDYPWVPCGIKKKENK